MSEQRQILEQYLKKKIRDKPELTILRLDKIADGWESDNHILTIEYGDVHRTREDWVWRIYSGRGSPEKANREFTSMEKLFAAGYPVPQVFLLETKRSPVDKPFIIMEYIPGEMMWEMINVAPVGKQAQLIDQFCQLFVHLHELDWKQFDDNTLPVDDPYFFVSYWLDDVKRDLQNFPEIDASPFMDWIGVHRDLFACKHPTPSHRDFHPGNILVRADGSAVVIDWTNFAVTDSRFDLAWTLMLAHAHGRSGLRDDILQGYQHHSGKPVEQIETFEAFACAQRLVHLTVSLTRGAQQMGMNAQATEAIRSSMEAHRRVYRLFIERTGLQIEAFDTLFGQSE